MGGRLRAAVLCDVRRTGAPARLRCGTGQARGRAGRCAPRAPRPPPSLRASRRLRSGAERQLARTNSPGAARAPHRTVPATGALASERVAGRWCGAEHTRRSSSREKRGPSGSSGSREDPAPISRRRRRRRRPRALLARSRGRSSSPACGCRAVAIPRGPSGSPLAQTQFLLKKAEFTMRGQTLTDRFSNPGASRWCDRGPTAPGLHVRTPSHGGACDDRRPRAVASSAASVRHPLRFPPGVPALAYPLGNSFHRTRCAAFRDAYEAGIVLNRPALRPRTGPAGSSYGSARRGFADAILGRSIAGIGTLWSPSGASSPAVGDRMVWGGCHGVRRIDEFTGNA